MSEPYTPTTAEVAQRYWESVTKEYPKALDPVAEFQDWLAAELAAAERVGAEKVTARIDAALDYMEDSDPDDWREAMRRILLPATTETGQA